MVVSEGRLHVGRDLGEIGGQRRQPVGIVERQCMTGDIAERHVAAATEELNAFRKLAP